MLGIPGTGNFIGEILILIGAFAIHPIFVTLATVSLVMAGLYSLMIIYHALFGQNTTLELVKQNHGTLKDLGKRELVLLLSLAIGLVWLGLYPQPVMDKSEGSMQWIASAYAHDVIMADEPMHGIRLIEGNMGDYMHAHHHQLHGQGYDAGIHHHKGSDGHHHDHQTKQGE